MTDRLGVTTLAYSKRSPSKCSLTDRVPGMTIHNEWIQKKLKKMKNYFWLLSQDLRIFQGLEAFLEPTIEMIERGPDLLILAFLRQVSSSVVS